MACMDSSGSRPFGVALSRTSSISDKVRRAGLIWLAYAAVGLAVTVWGSIHVPPDAEGPRRFGYFGFALLMVILYLVWVPIGLLFARSAWSTMRRKLEGAEVVTTSPAPARHRRLSWTAAMALYGAVLLVGGEAYLTFFQILTVNSFGWVLALIGTHWLDLSRRVRAFERAHDAVYYWTPEPLIVAWQRWQALRLPVSADDA